MKKLTNAILAGTAIGLLAVPAASAAPVPGSTSAAMPEMMTGVTPSPFGVDLTVTGPVPDRTIRLAQNQSTVPPDDEDEDAPAEAAPAESAPAAPEPAPAEAPPAAPEPAPAAPQPETPQPAPEAAPAPAPEVPQPAPEQPVAPQPEAAQPEAPKPEAAPAQPVQPAPPATAAPAAPEPAAPAAPAQPAEPAAPAQPAAPATPVTPAQPAEPAPAAPAPAAPAQPAPAGDAGALPQNAAPVLDSQKPRAGRGNRAAPAGEAQPAAQPAAPPASAPPPPQTDADAQGDAVRATEVQPVTAEEGRRIEGDQPRRRERREGVDVLREIGDRVIIELGDQVIVESNDRPRMTRGAREVFYEELPRGRVRETVVRENGVQIITVRDRYGDVIRRSRISPDGRESILVYADEERRGNRDGGRWRDPGDDLPPLVLTIPVDEYILDAEEASDDEAYYEFLDQPPVERVERLYSIDEVKRSARVRDSVRRVDLDTITFELGSASIAESEVARLDGVASAMTRLLEQNPAETFLIEGHTDAVGSDVSNLALSDQRAEAVAAALTSVFDIPPENLTTQGYGEQYLKVATEKPERQNRRVAIRRITPLVAPVAAAR